MLNEPDKSVAIYHPGALLENPMVWCTLCLFHDKLLIPYNFPFADIDGFPSIKPESLKRLEFFEERILRVLRNASVIDVVSVDRYHQLVPSSENIYDDAVDLIYKGYKNRENQRDDLKASNRFESLECAMAFSLSHALRLPFVSELPYFSPDGGYLLQAEHLAQILSFRSISQLSLPHIETPDPEDILEARDGFQEELMDFRAGMLKLTWLLHAKIEDSSVLPDILHEVDFLVNTKIKGSLMSLENRIKKHESKRIRRILTGVAKVLLQAGTIFLPGGIQAKAISGGKTVLQIVTEIESSESPEDEVASYLYNIKTKFETKMNL